jgi:DNA-binding transcriptional LysR family regulator
VALHAAVGALQASAAGGNALAGAAGAAAGEYVLTQVSSYLDQHPELTPGQRNAIQQWAAVVTGGAVGAAVGGGGAAQAGAAAGLDGERYNRQLHQDETKWIKANAKRFAQQQGITEQEAESRLAQQTFRHAIRRRGSRRCTSAQLPESGAGNAAGRSDLPNVWTGLHVLRNPGAKGQYRDVHWASGIGSQGVGILWKKWNYAADATANPGERE